MTTPSRRFSLVLLSLAMAVLLGSCNLLNPSPNYRLVEPEAVVPSRFLYNPDRVYNSWMDAPQRVYYHKISIDQIFSEKPFDDFRYELHDIPEDMELVTLDALGQSRRQLLWAISHDYNLKMTLLTTPGGRPSKVIVRWRGTGTSESRATDRGVTGKVGW